MRTLITLVVVLFCLQLWAQVPDTTSVAPGRLIIKVNQAFQTIGTRSDGIIETDQTWFNNLAVQYQIDVLRQMYAGSTRAYQQNKYLICFPDSIDLETIVTSFDLQSSVQDVRYDFYVHLCTNDPFNSYQWNMQRIKANDSYYTLAGSIQAPQAVRIAVVDTGIDFNHPDLTNNILRDQNNNVIGTNLVFPGQPAMDDNGHGTLVAGVIASRTNNNAGISSLVTGDNVKLMPIKAFNRFQQGWVSDVCSGIDWAIDNGAQIINCSWVTYQDNQYIPFEIQDIISGNPGVLFVAARGPINDMVTYPAFWARDFDNLLAVGGSDYNNFMSYNGIDPVIGDESIMTVCAPSGTPIQDPYWSPHDPLRGIVSTLPLDNQIPVYQMHYSLADPNYAAFQFGDWSNNTSFDYYTGTSISAAHVSGLLGMIWAQNYNSLNTPLQVQELKSIVKKSSQDFINHNHALTDLCFGAGIINAHEALMSPHPNLSMREYQVGTQTFSYPIYPYTPIENMPSMVWGSSQSFRVKVHNKWDPGTNVSIHLSSTDPYISFSYPNGMDHYVIGSIGAETDLLTNNMYIIDNSNRVRLNVPIGVKISVAGVPDRDYIITINVIQNTNVVASIMGLHPNETITTDIVVNDIDGNNNDEMFVGTSTGRLFCYRNGLWQSINTQLTNSIQINPSIADINSDGQKEIVVIDTVGNVRIFNNTYNLLRSYACFNNETTIGSIVLEDVTYDNILDIIYSTNHGTGSFVRVIDYANNEQREFSKDKNTVAALAVGDVDNLTGNEIVATYLHQTTYGGITRNFLSFSVLYFNNNSQLMELSYNVTTNEIESALSPHIVDINEDGRREIVWMLNYNNTSTRFIYSLIQNTAIDTYYLGFTTSICSEVAKVIESSNNIASIYSYSFTSGNFPRLGVMSGFQNDQDFYIATISPGALVKSFVLDSLLPAINGFSSQQLVLMTDHFLKVYNIPLNSIPPEQVPQEVWEYRTDYGTNVNIVSMATSQRGSNRILSVITDTGVLYEYYFSNPLNHIACTSQKRQTSRHTGCYEQPIPKEVHGNITIKHPFTVDKPLTTYSSIFTINEGVVGRFEAGRSLTLNRSDLYINGSEENPVILKGLGGGTSNEYWKGINVNNGSNLDMNWAEVTGAHQALDISYTGNRFIKNSKFYKNYQNVNCYNATVNMFYNYLTDAIHAVSAYHYASPMLNNTVLLQNGLNEIAGNEYGIFSDSSSPNLQSGHNNLENSRYNLYLQNPILVGRIIPAAYNWWGSADYREVVATINLPNSVGFTPFDSQPNHTLVREGQGSSMFEDGFAYMLNGEYHYAINCFNSVLADSLINESDVVSLYAMFECYNQLGEITLFETQLDQHIDDDDYTLLHKPMKNVRALIYRETERFSQAIDHYEAILLNNPSFQDSCYAVIDLGDTYLESNGRSSGQLTQYIPLSYTLHQQNREDLLSSIANGNDTEESNDTTPPLLLLGNYPNPFNPTTTIRFQMKADSNVKLEIYNIRGQKVTTLLNENRPAGLNSVVWNGKDSKNSPVASGVYFYRIESSNSTKTAKMLLLK